AVQRTKVEFSSRSEDMSGLSCLVTACDSAGNQFAASARRLQTWSESATVIDTRISHTPRGSVALSDPGRETLHVAHVVLSLDVGGLERGLINQIREGLKLGERITVICLERPGRLAPHLTTMEVPVLCLNKRPGIRLGLIGQTQRLLGY